MDKSTHDIRLANWLNIKKQWLSENNVDEKQYYYWLRKVRIETYDQMQLHAVAPSAEVSFAEVSYSADKLINGMPKNGMPFINCSIGC